MPWELIGIMLKITVVVGIFQGTVAYLILVERKIAAYAQDRLGPNRCGPGGLLQPLVDGAKFILKEEVIPAYVSKPLFLLAPAIAIIMATIGFAVVPFGPAAPTGSGVKAAPFNFQIAPGVDVGILYVFAIGSLAVYAIILAGWASNNKYSFLGGMRSSAQIISYEIPLGMSILGMVLLCGSLDLNAMINWQDSHTLSWIPLIGRYIPAWGIFVQPLGFLLFFVSAFAETNRLPFDLPEAEQELVGGFHTEYSAMKFGMFFLGEYLNIITICYLIVIVFLGGWDLPGLNQGQTEWWWAAAKVAVLLGKVLFLILFIMVIRWTLPRFRYDQLMDLAWKRMIPLAIVNFVVTAVVVQAVRTWAPG